MSHSCRKLIEFMMLIGRLKTTRRTGWVHHNVSLPESVSDHMYRMAAMAFLISPETGINKERCIKMALVHDMAECIVGDLTPSCGISKEDKHRREQEAMDHITSLVNQETGQELLSLWNEYEAETTPEAQFVKDLDKFEMILQAHEYEQDQKGSGELQDFFNSTQGKFRHPTVKGWVEELHKMRDEARQNSHPTHDS